jgi:hypothetical protein
MNIQIFENPLDLNLYGIGSLVENFQYAETGQRLMGELRQKIADSKLSPKSIVYWAYDSPTTMFVGYEFDDEAVARAALEEKPIKLKKHLYYRYVGAFDGLGDVHRNLEEEIKSRKLTEIGPRIEKYSDMSGEPKDYVTEIFVGLA